MRPPDSLTDSELALIVREQYADWQDPTPAEFRPQDCREPAWRGFAWTAPRVAVVAVAVALLVLLAPPFAPAATVLRHAVHGVLAGAVRIVDSASQPAAPVRPTPGPAPASTPTGRMVTSGPVAAPSVPPSSSPSASATQEPSPTAPPTPDITTPAASPSVPSPPVSTSPPPAGGASDTVSTIQALLAWLLGIPAR